MFQNDAKLLKDFADDLYFLKKYVVDVSRNRTEEENIEVMDDWSMKMSKKLAGLEFSPEVVAKLAKKYGPPLRDRTRQLFEMSSAAHVPVLVFSAGIGDVIQDILRDQNALTDNVKIAANFLKFNQGKISGMKNPDHQIHSFNKHLRIPESGQKLFDDWDLRSNVMVLGDLLGDAKMSDGFEKCDNILKIGFLHFKVQIS